MTAPRMHPAGSSPGETAARERAPLRTRATGVIAVTAMAAAAVVVLISVVATEPRLLMLSGIGVAVGAIAAIQRALHREDPALLMLVAAAAVAAGSRFVPESAVPSVVAAVAMVSIVVISVVEAHRRGAVLAVSIYSLLGLALFGGSVDGGRIAGFVCLVLAGGGSWTVLDRLMRQMHARETGYRNLFDRVPVGLYRTGRDGELLELNSALADLLGAEREELIGRRAQDFFVDDGDFARLRATIGRRPDPVTTDIRFRRRDGAIIWVRDVTRPVIDENGHLVCFEGEIQDVTEQRHHIEELETLVRSKSELIGAVSHELRTPLTAVVGFLDVLNDPAHGAAEDMDLLRIACAQAHDVAAIVEDLLTAARLDNRELVVREELIDVRDVVNDVVASLAVTGMVVRVQAPPGVAAQADGSRVRQILRNLIGNASRHGAPPIVIDTADGLNEVDIIVGDAGALIPTEVVAHMWDPFYSGSENGTATPGSIGLGLAISRRLARLMGGDLTHRRRANRTEFVLTLRCADVLRRSA
ncbi:MAG: HAMP domain-containing sensor histidine kinase [Actinomycetota bacterium]